MGDDEHKKDNEATIVNSLYTFENMQQYPMFHGHTHCILWLLPGSRAAGGNKIDLKHGAFMYIHIHNLWQ